MLNDSSIGQILVVDDEPGIRRVLRRLLSPAGYEVSEAASLAETQAELTAIQHDAVLCDLSLEHESGLDVARWIRETFPELPILMITGAASQHVHGLQDLDVDGLILKPFERDEVLINLAKVLERSNRQRTELDSLESALEESEVRLGQTSDRLKATQFEMMKNARVWESLVSSAGIGVVVVNSDGSCEFVNPRAVEMLGLSPFCEGRAWLAPFSANDRTAIMELVTAASSTQFALQVNAGVGLTQRSFSIRASSFHLGATEGAGVVVNIEDVTELVTAKTELERQLTLDPITGLANRTTLGLRLSNALNRRSASLRSGEAAPETRVGVVSLSLETMRNVARVDGEHIFEDLMIEVGARLGDTLNDDELLGRSGPGHFSVVAETTDLAYILSSLPARILKSFDQPLGTRSHDYHLVPCVGVVIAGDTSSPDSLLRDSTLAADQVDSAGGIRVFNKSLREEALQRLKLEQQLRLAVEGQSTGIEYQPIVSASDKGLVGLEALSRWQHPTLGNVSPGVFIPIAEDLGIIGELGNSVLHRVISQIAEWNRTIGPTGVWVSCNVSPRQLDDPTFPSVVRAALRREGVPPHQLCLEFTEDSTLTKTSRRSALSELRAIGVQLALDDFGTGYSSLSYLIELDFDILKLAGELLPASEAGGSASPSVGLVIRAVIGLSHALSMDVVAERVETDAQWADLLDLDADLIQGWNFSKSRAADDPFVTRLLLDRLDSATSDAPAVLEG